MTTIGEALLGGSQRLKNAGIASCGLEAALLLARVTGLDRLKLITRSTSELSAAEQAAFRALLDRRAAREPFQHLVGVQEFMGLEFVVTPDVLIPRPDTEILVETVLDRFETLGVSGGLVADLGTGSGAIAVALARYLPNLTVVATDVSEAAIAIARKNAGTHGMADRITFLQGSGLTPLSPYEGRLVVLVSNPPYVAEALREALDPEVRDHEPALALFAPEDGLYWYRVLAEGAAPLLAPGGAIALEVGAGQAEAVVELLHSHGWQAPEIREDLAGIARVVMAGRP